MSYEFRKLYADLVTPDGTLCVLYLTWARLLGRWVGRSGVEVYGADGSRAVFPGQGDVPLLDPSAFDGRLRVVLADGPFEMDLEPVHGAFCPPPPPTCPSLKWAVVMARGGARARGLRRGELSGTGYVDYVTLTRPTRLLHFATLEWGRAHLAEATGVYTALTFADGRRWHVGARWPGQSPEPVDVAVNIDTHGAGAVSLGATTLLIAPDRVLHDGDAFGPERVGNALERLVVRALGGRTLETRWMGEARFAGARDPGAAGWAVYERVRFGSAEGP